jgi:hypothetical protein
MKERPILFSAPMVRAILEGRKSQTRRVIDPQPDIPHWMSLIEMEPKNGLARFRKVAPDWPDDSRDDIYCQYGKPGDRLWVRETWKTDREYDPWAPCQIDSGASIFFMADQCAHRINHRFECGPHEWGKTRSSIHMPRWASRITLEITGIRVERLQNISAADVAAEGVEPEDGKTYPAIGIHTAAYMELWDAINAKRGHPWESNPWVWVIEFRRIV